MNFVATKLPDVGDQYCNTVTSEDYSNNGYDTVSITSTICSSTPTNNDNYTSNFMENVAATSGVNVGSITVQNGTDITFGNKIFFNAPVEINHLVFDCAERNAVVTKANNEPAKLKMSWRARTQNYIVNHPWKACWCVSATTMMVATLIIFGYFFDPYYTPIKSTCEEIPSDPTYYECEYPSACALCRELFSHKKICRASYDRICGDPQCYCEPQCLQKDCRD